MIKENLSKINSPNYSLERKKVFKEKNDRLALYLKKELEEREIYYEGKEEKFPSDLEEGTEVDFYSVHQSKGREAEHVILVHVVEGEIYSFPAEEKEDKLLAPVKKGKTNSIAEERRLFYVAITRVEGTLDILSKIGSEFRFVTEIRDFLKVERGIANPGQPGDRIEIKALVNWVKENTGDKIQQVGFLKNTTGSKKFISFANSNAPQLDEKARYRLKQVKVNEYRDNIQLLLDSKTEAVKIYQH